MWFHIRVIKSISQKEYSIDTIINFPTQKDLNSFLDTYKVLAISTHNYDKEPEKFGDTYGSIQVDNERHDFVTHAAIADTVLVMTMFGWEITAINSYNTPLDNSESIATIKQIRHDVQQQLEQIEKTKRSNSDTKKSHTNKVSKDIQQSVDKVLQDAEHAMDSYNGEKTIIQKIHDNMQTLKKMRLSKNTEKISEIIYQLYRYIDNMEQSYIATLPNKPINVDSHVSIPYFVRVYDRRRRSQKLGSITGHKHIGEKLYARGWEYILFVQFLGIDMYQSFITWRPQAQGVMRYIVLIILSTTIVVTASGLFISIFWQESLESILALQLLRIGILGFALWSWYLISKRTLRHTTTILLISMSIFVCLHYLSRRFLILH